MVTTLASIQRHYVNNSARHDIMDLCQSCRQKKAVYTCPRCGIHTCSLKCSQSHKVDKACSGERDRTAYVPMNKYDWGTMTSDYTYLEEVGRKTTEWGRHIVKDGLMSRPNRGSRGGQPTRNYGVGGKKESLRLQLQARDIDMEVLPNGMERSKLNRSSYDVKTKSILLTVEIVINFPKSVTSGSSFIRILSHKNNLSSTLDSAVFKGLRDHVGRTKQVDPWLTEIAKPNARDDYIFLIAQISSDAVSMVNSKVYHKLNPRATLQSVLGSKTFVEYPTIVVWPEGEFSGVMQDESGEILDVKVQRSKAPNRVDKKAITSLLQDYASQDEDDRQDDVLEMLGDYTSDNEPQPGNIVEHSSTEEECMEEDEAGPGREDVIRAVLDAATQCTLVPPDEPLSDDENEESWKDSEDEDSTLLKALEKQTRLQKA